MSALKNSQPVWPTISKENLSSKYEKCRNITEEIYKRIDITFQIKKLENTQSDISDQSDQLDSNELSNETDLFACDKSDSIPSSTEPEKPQEAKVPADKCVNINNNEEKKNSAVYKRPKKKFRKRVKKRAAGAPRPRSESDASSDEALPLSRMLDADSKAESPGGFMGVPKIVIVTKDLKPRIISLEKKPSQKIVDHTQETKTESTTDNTTVRDAAGTIDKVKESGREEKSAKEARSCEMCKMSFRGERGLRRHLAMSHITPPEEPPRKPARDLRGVKPA